MNNHRNTTTNTNTISIISHDTATTTASATMEDYVPVEVIRDDWVTVRNTRERQLQSLSIDQLKNVANLCLPEPFRSADETTTTTKNRKEYQNVIMNVLDTVFEACMDIDKTKKKRLRSFHHFTKCLEIIDQVRNDPTTTTTTNDDDIPTATTTEGQEEEEEGEEEGDTLDKEQDEDQFPFIDLEDCLDTNFTTTTNNVEPNTTNSTNPGTARHNIMNDVVPAVGSKVRGLVVSTESNSNHTTNGNTTTATHKIASPIANITTTTTADLVPLPSVSITTQEGGNKDNLPSSSSSPPASFLSFLQKGTISTTTTTTNNSSTASTTTTTTPTTKATNSISTTLITNNNDNPSLQQYNNNNTIDTSTSFRPFTVGKKVLNLQSSDFSTVSRMVDIPDSTTSTTTPANITTTSSSSPPYLPPTMEITSTMIHYDKTDHRTEENTNEKQQQKNLSIDRLDENTKGKQQQKEPSIDLSGEDTKEKQQQKNLSIDRSDENTKEKQQQKNLSIDRSDENTKEKQQQSKPSFIANNGGGNENTNWNQETAKNTVTSNNNKNNNIAKDKPQLMVFNPNQHTFFVYPSLNLDNTICSFDIGATVEPYVASLSTRRPCRVRYTVPPFPSMLKDLTEDTVNVRFNRWDPFNKCLYDIVNFVKDKTTNQIVQVRYCHTSTLTREQFPYLVTAPVDSCIAIDGRGRPTAGAIDANIKPKTCLEVNFQFPKDIANHVQNWGFESLAGPNDDKTNRLICRMLPLDSKAMKKEFADTHLWPKGTYMEVNGKPVLLQQRRQQSHDPTQWKGMCKQLDLTPYIAVPISINRVKLVTQENACYALQICIAEQRSPLTVFEEALKSIPTVPRNVALERAKQYVNNQTVCLDDNVAVGGSRSKYKQEGEVPSDSSHLTFKLVCPISMTVMVEPVRGKRCQHFQCFDLFNFIETNSFPSGRRWKCPCCDSFVSLDSLELCGWFKDILMVHESKVTADGIDSVKMFSNGQWELVNPSSTSSKRNADVVAQQALKRNKVALEVIEID